PRPVNVRPNLSTASNTIKTGRVNVNTGNEQVSPGHIEAVSPSAHNVEEVFSDDDDDEMPEMRIYDKSSEGIFEQASYDDDGVITDFNNLPDEVDVITNPTLRIHNAHPQSQILGDPNTPVQTRSSLKKITEAHALKSDIKPFEDGIWVELCKKELLQFKLQQVWVLWLIYPQGAKVIARIEAIRLFLAFASFMGFIVYQMDVKSAFLYGTIDEEVYVSQPPGFVDTTTYTGNSKDFSSQCCQEDLQISQGQTKLRIMVSRQLQLADASGIHMLQNEEIFAGLQNIGSKSGGWDQFGSNIAIALICLSTGRDFNFSKLIFDGMISNLKSKSKFLMYPRFLQMILNVQTENKNLFVPVSLTKKIFGNMKRSFQGIHRPLLPAMLTIDAGQPQPSAAPTPSHPVPTPTSSHVQITQSPTPPPPSTLTQPVQSSSTPPQPSSVQPTATTPPPPITSSPPVSTIPDIQPTFPPSPQIPSPSYHDTEGPSFEPSYHMSPPPSHEP
ncbi:putative ribonuclease H-like domain-containing protein, partial [Tanacetum coccineum]